MVISLKGFWPPVGKLYSAGICVASMNGNTKIGICFHYMQYCVYHIKIE